MLNDIPYNPILVSSGVLLPTQNKIRLELIQSFDGIVKTISSVHVITILIRALQMTNIIKTLE